MVSKKRFEITADTSNSPTATHIKYVAQTRRNAESRAAVLRAQGRINVQVKEVTLPNEDLQQRSNR